MTAERLILVVRRDSRGYRGSLRGVTALAFCFSPLVVAVGCSQAPSNRGQVTGRVTVDGANAQSGAISFTPVDGASPAAGGKIVEGKFSVDAPIGVSKVAIRVPKIVGEQKLYNTPDSPVMPVKAESLPKKFNDETKLTYEVTAGPNQKDFALSTHE